MGMQLSSALQLFYSYAHEDRVFLKKLEKHLSMLKRQGLIAGWHDQNISAGQLWEKEVNTHLQQAQIILLLVSSDFLASDYCYSIEMTYAMERCAKNEALVIPIILRPCEWKEAPFSKLLALPDGGKAVTKWSDKDSAFLNIAQGIRRAIQKRERSFTERVSPLSQTIWNVPYRRNALFTGREEMLVRLHQSFGQHGLLLQAITGLGGIGKTQIALEYAYRYQDSYQAVLWVNAASRDTIIADFMMLVNRLHLSGSGEHDQNIIVAVIKRWLSEHRQWLLIMDNVDDLDLAHDFLPQKGGGHVLLTTRAQVAGSIAMCVEVEKMNFDEGALLLLRRSKELAIEGTLAEVAEDILLPAKKIVQAMDGLPLALDQAGAYIEETGCGVAEYLEHYQQRSTILLQRRGWAPGNYPASVATTWSLSFERLEQQNPMAVDLLRVCALLAPDAIPQSLIERGASELGPLLASVPTNTSLFDEAIAALRLFSLIKRNSRKKQLAIHRLVQIVVKENLDPGQQIYWAERTVRAVIRAFPGRDETLWSEAEYYIPHIYVCVEMIEQNNLISIDASQLFYSAGRFLHEQAQYKQAEIFYQEALTMAKRFSDQHILARTLDSLAWLYLDQGHDAQAEPLYQQALALKQQMFGPTHVDTADTLHALGRLYQVQRHFSQAENYYRQTLAIREQQLGSDHSETAKTLHALAWLYQDQKRHEEALPLFQQALAIRQQTLGLKHTSTAITLHQLAHLYQDLGENGKAETFYQQALQIKEEVLGIEHPFTADTQHQFARFYHALHLYSKAEKLYHDALRTREHVLGPDHPFTATTLHHLARLYHNQKRYDEALLVYQRALTIREQALGTDHPFTAITLHQLAHLYQDRGDYIRAEDFYRRVLAIREHTFGLTDPTTRSVVKKYAHLLRLMQREQEADSLEERLK